MDSQICGQSRDIGQDAFQMWQAVEMNNKPCSEGSHLYTIKPEPIYASHQ